MKFLESFFEIDGVQFGRFLLNSHANGSRTPPSPFYINTRILRSHPDINELALLLLWEKIKKCAFDMLADVPTAATPFVAALGSRHSIPWITPRGKKVHGSKSEIEGVFMPEQIILPIEDVLTSARSTLAVIDILESHELQVHDVVVFFDRGQGGRQRLEKRGHKVHAVFTLEEALSFSVVKEEINQEVYDEVMEYTTRYQL